MANRREVLNALKNRLELVKAGLTRRDLIKMGLMTGAGVLMPKRGVTHPQLSSLNCSTGCNVGCSPMLLLLIPFWVIANDGNLLPTPVQVTSFRKPVATEE